MPDKSEIWTTMPEESVLRQAELTVLRQMSDNMSRIRDEMKGMGDKHDKLAENVGLLRTDIAVMQEQNKDLSELKAEYVKLEARVKICETFQSQLSGAGNFAQWLREFGPWLVSLGILAWGLFKH